MLSAYLLAESQHGTLSPDPLPLRKPVSYPTCPRVQSTLTPQLVVESESIHAGGMISV